ncbi:MAG: hypothetical protein MJZ17_05345 [Bacteroidales bacterium]|nr:hypothetical protein [Bacteroidales bacterium]
MSLDLVQEHDSMLSKCGSFWYGTVNMRDKRIARVFNGMACHTDAVSRLANIADAVLSGGYFVGHNAVVRFSDKDMSYNGADKVLQELYGGAVEPGEDITVHNVTAVAGACCDREPLSDEKRLPVMFPADADMESDMVVPANYRALFGLKVDDDIMVTTIETPDGGIMIEGIDFMSEFGRLWLQRNPVTEFPDMKFTARSFVLRARNIYCYSLGLDNIYGPVDRVMTYYRESQSPKAFKFAAAQACGLAVTRAACRITGSEPLLSGWSYRTLSGGRIDAPYPHAKIKDNTVLPADYIVGGGELFDMVLPGESGDSLTEIDTAPALPSGAVVPRKTICSKCVVDGVEYDRPVDCAPGDDPVNGNELFNWYWKWMAAEDGGPEAWEDGMEAAGAVDSIDWVLGTACRGNCIVVRINSGFMPYGMQVKLHNFVDREAPIGCLLTYSPITSTIVED